MTSKAERLRRKKARGELPKLSKGKVAPKMGRPTKTSKNDDQALQVLEARARQMGRPKSKAKDMRAQFLGDPAGMAIALECGYEKRAGLEETKRLWDHYAAMTGAEARYHKSLGTSMHPKGSKAETAPQKMEARADDVIDLRTEEERDIAAARKWMLWQGNIGMLESWMQTAIHDVARGRAAPVDAGAITMAGQRFVHAMRVMDKRMQEFGR